MSSKILKKTFAFSFAALLLGTSFTNSCWAMINEEPKEHNSLKKMNQIYKLENYSDLVTKAASSLTSPIQPGDLFLINVGHGIVQSCTQVSERNTDINLFEKHKEFIAFIKMWNEADYLALTRKAKLGSGDEGKEFVKVGEKGLPTLLDNLSNSGANIIPVSSRCDDGANATNEAQEIFSRTEKEFRKLNYDYTNWKRPIISQNRELKDHNPEVH